MYKIRLSVTAEKSIDRFCKSNVTAYKKVIVLLKSISQTPREGLGRPEPLKKGNNTIYSRRIDKKNRMVYEIFDDTVQVLIISAEGHYDDK